MKRTFFATFLLIITLSLPASTSLSFGAGYMSFSGEAKDIYNKSNIFYTAELSFKMKSLDLFTNLNINNFKGELSYNKDESNLKLNQLEIGIKLPLGNKTAPYIGAGSGITFYNENNSIGKASGTGFGFFGIGGIKIGLGKVFVDLRAKYTMLKIKGVDLSGISGIVMLGINFK